MSFALLRPSPKSRLLKKRYLLVLGLLVALIIGWQITHRASQPASETHQVSLADIAESVVASGNIQPDGKVEIFSSTNGVITEFFVDNAQYVEAGQELFRVASTATPEQKAKARAAYTSALAARQKAQQDKFTTQASLEAARQSILNAQNAVDRMETNLQESRPNPVTGEDYSQLEKESIYSSLTSARQAFEQAEQKYQEYDTQIAAASQEERAKLIGLDATDDQVVVAPVPGTIANIGPGIGEEVFIASQLSSIPVMTLTDFTAYTIKVEIKESDIYRISTGQKARVTLDAIPDTEFSATVKRIDSLGQAQAGLVTYQVTLDLVENDTRIRPGMTTNVWIQTQSASQVVVVPNSYLTIENDQIGVYRQTPAGEEFIVVEPGIKNESYTQVVEGISANDIIVRKVNEK